MDYPNSDKTNEMVRNTLNLADDSTELKKLACKRIYDEPEFEPMNKTVREANESLQIQDEDLMEDSYNWYQNIPSYLDIEIKEDENQQASCGGSTENTENSFKTYCPASSHGIIYSSGNSFNDPLDLSAKYLKPKSQEDATNNNSYKSPIRTQDTKSKYLETACADGRDTSSITGGDKIMQDEISCHFPRAMHSRTTYPIPNEKQTDSGEVMAIARRIMPSTNQSFSMTIHRNLPVNIGFANVEKPEITAQNNIPVILNQGVPSLLVTNDGHFSMDTTNYEHSSMDTTNYEHSSNQSHSETNRYYNWPQGFQGNANTIPMTNEFAERIRDIPVNNLEQNSANHLKRPLTNCVQIDSNDAQQPVYPPKKRKSYGKSTTYYCNLCGSTFRSCNGYNRHLKSEKHLKMVNQANLLWPNLYNFQPNSAIRSFAPMNVQAQLPPPHLLYLMSNQMWYYHYQANAMSTANQSGDARKINNTVVQKTDPGTSKPNKSLDHIGSQNKDYAQNPRLVNLPVSHTSNPQGICLPPSNPQSENSMMANPKYLENKEFQSGYPLKDLSPEIQSENSTATCSFQESKDVQPVSHNQVDFFRIYHCMVCSVFHTDCFQELQKHVCADRSRTPFDMITTSGNDSLCKLCDFSTQISNEMALHCASQFHMQRLEYYNHVMEGGINVNDKLKYMHNFSPVLLFCSACELSTESMDILKYHSADPRHLHNVSCCIYVASFNRTVEYCFCRPCIVKTPTKRELLIHIRSEEHWNKLQNYPSNDSRVQDPGTLLFIKESKRNELQRDLQESINSTFIEAERSYFTETNNDNKDITDNPTPVDSDSSTSLQLLPISCCLCQQMFSEINVLEQHLQRIHDVNEAGVKWLVSTIRPKNLNLHEEKFLPAEELTKTSKNIVFSPQKSSVDENLPIERMSIASSSNQTCVATEQNVESETSACLGTVTSRKSVTTDQNQEKITGTESPSRQQPYETKYMWDSDKLDQTPRANPHRRSSIDSSSNQQFRDIESMRNSNDSDQNLDLDQVRRINMDSPSRQQVRNSENMLPVGEEKINSDEKLNFNSSQEEIMTKNESELNRHRKRTSEHFSPIEHGSPISQSDLNPNEEKNDPFSRGHNSVTHERLPTTYDSSSEHFSATEDGPSISQSVLNASRESYDSSSSDDSSVTYELMPEKEKKISSTEKSSLSPSSFQNYLLDSQNRRSPIEDQPNLHLRRNVGNDSPVNRLMTLVESNQPCHLDSQNRRSTIEDKTNLNFRTKLGNDSQIGGLSVLVEPKRKANSSNLFMRENSDDNGQMESSNSAKDHNSPATINTRLQAEKDIENIEISDVFSLTDCVDTINNSDEDEESLHIEDIEFSDLEEL